MTKREFLRTLAVSAVMTAAPRPAGAERPRLLPSEARPQPPTATGVRSAELQQLLAGVQIGESRTHDAMMVFWLHAPGPIASLPIVTLDDARARGELNVTEQAQANVPMLTVDNRGKAHVLLVAGEIVLGGKQDRVVKEDLLLPPLSGPRDVAVYCVEQGRWAGRPTPFKSQGSFAGPAVRSQLLERAEQSKVWDAVSQSAARAAAPSATGRYQAVFDKPEAIAKQREAERALDPGAAPDARGAAVFLGTRLAGLDLFIQSPLFARLWPKLLRGYTAEVQGGPPQPEDRLRGQVKALLAAAAGQAGTVRPSAGVGQLFEFRVTGARGTALLAEGQVVHVALL